MHKDIKLLSAATFIISACCAAEYKEPVVIDSGDFYQTLTVRGASSSGWGDGDVPFDNGETWYIAIGGSDNSADSDITFSNIDAQFETQNGVYITQDNNIIKANVQPIDVGLMWFRNVNWSTGGETLAFVSSGGGVDEIYVDETSKLSSDERTIWIGEGGRLNSWLQNKGEISGTVAGITNAGTAAGLYNYGKINAGSFGIELRDTATTESVINYGEITGGTAGIINDGVIDTRIYNSGTINGGVINSGVINGNIENTGIINGGLTNTGKISGQIINTGSITGDVNLGDASLLIAGDKSVIEGLISGTDKSAVSIGNKANTAQFNAAYNASIGALGIAENSVLTLDNNISWSTSDTTIEGILTLNDRASISGQVKNNGTLALRNDGAVTSATVNGNLHNAGSIILNPDKSLAGNVLTITGNYNGEQGSQIYLNSVLGQDSSSTDKMVINGNMAGSSEILVNNLGGKGDYTHDGIEIIHVDGMSEGQFTLGGRAVAGSYEYYLYKGDLKGENQNWYLRSELPPEPTPEPTPEPAPGSEKVYRPEAGSYIAGIAASNTMFNIRLHDRAGETYYSDPLSGERAVTSMWMNHIGGHNAWKDGSSQLKTQSNRYVLQLGGDIAQWADGKDQLHIGVMGGYGNEKSTTTSSLSHYNSKGTVEGYSLGMYATWQQFKGNDDSGAYTDVWAQYSWFDNTVNGEQLAGETWKSRGVTASAEAGYTFKAGEFTGSHGSAYNWYIQPQAQLTWMNVRSEDHRENNGTNVRAQGEGNVQSRLGARVFLKGKSHLKTVKDRSFEPFIEANWIHNTRSWGVKMDDVLVTQDGARDVGEIKTGIEGQLSANLNLWGNVGVQVGDKGYNNTQGMLGIRYSF